MLRRFQDLITPFKNGWLVHPAFEGSTSIKAVLPALVPSMTYEGMAVADGGGAIRAYAEFLKPETTPKRRREIREDLLAYCGQDTLAMVKVLEALGSWCLGMPEMKKGPGAIPGLLCFWWLGSGQAGEEIDQAG